MWKEAVVFGIRREKLRKTANTSVTFFKSLKEIINEHLAGKAKFHGYIKQLDAQ
jgi:hypothetical protein